jgi:hypothetical protein
MTPGRHGVGKLQIRRLVAAGNDLPTHGYGYGLAAIRTLFNQQTWHRRFPDSVKDTPNGNPAVWMRTFLSYEYPCFPAAGQRGDRESFGFVTDLSRRQPVVLADGPHRSPDAPQSNANTCIGSRAGDSK